MNKAVITILGADRVGIIAAVSTYLAKVNVNILDINQTIMEELFTMVTMVDINEATKPFDEIYNDLNELGKELGVVIQIQRAEIFQSMHKI
ncbi:MAG: ACT domain-containing protein [Clostridia bacterium]|nr:ACT domain-containing protein [Clostridia bacterium]